MRRFALALAVLAAGCNDDPADPPNPSTDADASVDGDASIDGAFDSAPDVPAVVPVRGCKTTLAFSLGGVGADVQVAGEWDGFVAKTKLLDPALTGNYRVSLDLPAGDYGYKLIVDGVWQLDPTQGKTKWVGGVENSRLLVDDCKRPHASVVRADAAATGLVQVEIQMEDGAEAKGLDPASLAATLDRAPTTAKLDASSGRVLLDASALTKGKHTFTFSMKDKAGRASNRLIVPMWVEDERFAWTDGPLYFVFTDRFRNGDPKNDKKVPGVDDRANYQGGDFAGVTQAIEEGYFDKLGVRSLWLSPVSANTDKPGKGGDGRDYSGYHGYWVSDPKNPEERFGTMDELRALTKAAHARGIRVIFDLVQNQLHQDHPYVAAHSKDGWFNGDGSCVCGGPSCSWDEHPVDCWFTNYLPDVNWTNQAMADQMVADAMTLLEEADGDGFRVDAVKHMNDNASTSLRAVMTETFETGNAKYYTVGETFTGGDDGGRALIKRYVGPQRLHGQFDFPLFWSIDSAFAQLGGTMGDLEAATAKSDTSYGPGALMSPFLGNHDVTRFLSRAAGQIGSNPQEQAWTGPPAAPTTDEPYDRAFLAFTFLLAQPGLPLVYYGDEVGTPGTADPDNRRFLKAEKDLSAREKKLLDRIRIVAKARGTYLGLRRGARRSIFTDGDGYVFVRGTGKDAVIVAMNRGTTTRTVKVSVPAELGLTDGQSWKDLLGGLPVKVNAGQIEVVFGPKSAALLVP